MNKEVKPITPDEVHVKKNELIPKDVLLVVNNMITENYSVITKQSVVRQPALARRIAEFMHIKKEEVFSKHYLDFEEIYREAGWNVVYDKPAYNEDYEATFTFSRK